MKRTAFMVAQPHCLDVMERVLASRIGISVEFFREVFDLICCQSWADPFGITHDVAKANVKNILPLLEGRNIILIGDEVVRLFEMESCEKYMRLDHPVWEDFHALFYIIDSPFAPTEDRRTLIDSSLSMFFNIYQEEKWQRAASNSVTS